MCQEHRICKKTGLFLSETLERHGLIHVEQRQRLVAWLKDYNSVMMKHKNISGPDGSIKVMLFRCSYDVKLVSGLITVTVNAVTDRRLIRLFVSTVTFAVLVFMMTSASVQTTDWNRDVTIAVERCTIHEQTIDKTTSKWVSGGYYALPTRDRTVNALQTSQSTMPHSLMLITQHWQLINLHYY